MASVTYGDSHYAVEGGETVLDCLQRNGLPIPSSCRSGVCQSCLMRATSGSIPEKAQSGLRETLKRRDYFLACSCVPEDDLTVALPDESAPQIEATLESLERVSETVLRVRARSNEAFEYSGGQFVNLVRPEGLVRSYSLASVPAIDAYIELHVARVPQGRMSGWLFDEAQPGDSLVVRGPQGNCFYTGEKAEQPLLLAGTGTGLAPLYGIARDALHSGHGAPIHLYHGALRPEGLYLVDELRALDAAHEHFHYHPCALEGDGNGGIAIGAVDGLILGEHPDFSGWRVYLCGAPEFVKLMQRKAFLAKASLGDIFSDAFLPSA